MGPPVVSGYRRGLSADATDGIGAVRSAAIRPGGVAMSTPDLVYRHAVNPKRGLAATGIVFIKLLLALPHLIIINALQYLGVVAAYIGYFVVAFTGTMPGGLYRFMEIWMGWHARTYGWIIGYSDVYPPFETDPVYPVAVTVAKPENPSKGWAVAGIFFLKFVVLIPHFIALALVLTASALAVWFGYFAVLFTGSLPEGIQDFAAGAMQWSLRVFAFLMGITDDYPKFSLQVTPTA
jgi:hypothetical protein